MANLEDASQLQLGDFADKECMNNSVVALALEKIAQNEEEEESKVFKDMFEYVRRFNKYKKSSAVNEVDNLLSRYSDLRSFEKACLANLSPETVEEAQKLIPSLKSRINDESLDNILKNLKSIQQFVSQ